MEEIDWEKEYEELQNKYEKLQEVYKSVLREKYDTGSENRELKSMNDRLLKIIENLSEGLTR